MQHITYKTSFGNLNFGAFPKDSAWPATPGIYMFCQTVGLLGDIVNPPRYLGQTVSFAERLPDHDRWDEAAKLGANCVLIAPISNAHNRDKIERELIASLRPPLNTHYKATGLLGTSL
jgi:hypothetical protein